MESSCISSDRMRAFLGGTLTADDDESIARHLDDCQTCEQLAAALSDDLPTRQLARDSRRQSAHSFAAAELNDLYRRIHALGRFSVEAFRKDEIGANRGRDESANDSRPLTRLGNYNIVRKLGAGSFGIVYLAEDRRLHRKVAIKVAQAGVLADPALRQRFRREAEALARLEHPHIVPVYEVDETDGLCYLVLAYCDGLALDQWFAQQAGPLDGQTAVRLILPLVEAVEHAHTRGILHRDIKPANVLLATENTADGLPASLRLTDFGLAKVLEEKTSTTLIGTVLGSVHYMAPEQAAGHLERIGPATDVYSIGVVLFELVTGQLPIVGNSVLDTLRRLLIDEPPEAATIVRGVPDDLSAIIHKCLQKSPSQRYASAAALAEDLQRFVRGLPTAARPLSPLERFSRRVVRHKTVAALSAMAAAVIGLSFGLFNFADRLSRSQSQTRNAVEKLDRVAEQVQQREFDLAQQAYAHDLAIAGKSTAKGDIAHASDALRRQIPSHGKPDLRGLEWHYLWALTTHDPRTYVDTGNEIYHLCLSPDREELAAVGSRGLLRIYQAASLQLKFVIPTGQGESNGVAYSSTGQLTATAGDDGTIRVFDLASRKECLKIDAHHGKAYGVVFFDGDRKLATCGAEPVIRLWDAATGDPIGTLEKHQGRVEAIALAPAGDLLASAGSDKTAVLWDLSQQSVKRTLKGHREALMSICFSPDGTLLATGATDNRVLLWDVPTGRRQGGANQLDKVQSIAFSADGSRLYVGDRNGAVHQYRVGRRQPTDGRQRLDLDDSARSWHAHNTRIWSVTAGEDADTFYTAGADHLLRRWDRRQAPPSEITIASPSNDPFVDLEYSPDGQRLFALSQYGGVWVLDSSTQQVLFSLTYSRGPWRTMEVLHGRDEIAAVSARGELVIWDYKTRERRALLEPIGDNLRAASLSYSRPNHLLALAAEGLPEIRLYDVANLELVKTFPAAHHSAVAFSPSGRQLAVDVHHNIEIFDVDTGMCLQTIGGHSASVTCLAFSPDGKLLASGSGDRRAQLWTVEGEHLFTLTSHLAGLREVRFTPDGRTLLSLDERGAVETTHVASQQALFELPIDAERLRALAVAPNSLQFAAIRTLRGTNEIVVLGPSLQTAP